MRIDSKRYSFTAMMLTTTVAASSAGMSTLSCSEGTCSCFDRHEGLDISATAGATLSLEDGVCKSADIACLSPTGTPREHCTLFRIIPKESGSCTFNVTIGTTVSRKTTRFIHVDNCCGEGTYVAQGESPEWDSNVDAGPGI